MSLLGIVLTILAIGLGLMIFSPLIGAGLAALLMLGCLLIWLLPILIIVASDVTTTGEKIAWIIAIVCFSWFAWIFYFFLAPLKERPQRYRYY